MPNIEFVDEKQLIEEAKDFLWQQITDDNKRKIINIYQMTENKKGLIKHFKIKDSCPDINIWEYAVNNRGTLPLDSIDEVSIESRLCDNEGKTMSYFTPQVFPTVFEIETLGECLCGKSRATYNENGTQIINVEAFRCPIHSDDKEKGLNTEILKIDFTGSRVWVKIDNIGIGFAKENFIELIKESDSYRSAVELGE
ncbi:hypothetical protein [Ferruginibacter albus]|uniref:hypothetical protein n=1 Tax=Ferruginibacter albus TaxID=2875540 RepID=UPI001CC4BB37|nr:hypothetical protein [Ferruginibacter albus]UAY53429.1 hypothetical protein K9M53_07085 [Ferruginibacter albus]